MRPRNGPQIEDSSDDNHGSFVVEINLGILSCQLPRPQSSILGRNGVLWGPETPSPVRFVLQVSPPSLAKRKTGCSGMASSPGVGHEEQTRFGPSSHLLAKVEGEEVTNQTSND